MTDKTKPRRARRAPYFGPIDTSQPRRAESEDDAQITVGFEAGDDQ